MAYAVITRREHSSGAFYSEGKTADGQVIRTKDASLEGYSCEEGTDKLGAYHRMTARYCHGALRLHQMVTAYDGGELTVQVKLHDTRGKTATRFLAPGGNALSHVGRTNAVFIAGPENAGRSV